MPTPHKHAALIKQWADDPSQTVWSWMPSTHPDSRPGYWKPCDPLWIETTHYAVGPRPGNPPRKMCVLAGVEFPAPETTAPPNHTRYWSAGADWVRYAMWYSDIEDKTRLAGGLVHLTREAAEQHSKALLAANKAAIEGAS